MTTAVLSTIFRFLVAMILILIRGYHGLSAISAEDVAWSILFVALLSPITDLLAARLATRPVPRVGRR